MKLRLFLKLHKLQLCKEIIYGLPKFVCVLSSPVSGCTSRSERSAARQSMNFVDVASIKF